MPIRVSLPAGYRAVTAPGAWGFASAGAHAWVAEVLRAGETLHAWAERHPARSELAGRGRAWAVPAPAPGGADRWIVRHYLRGGAIAYWLRDRYVALGRTRPVQELSACLEISRRGIPTPAAVAGAVYPAGPFYRADLVTEAIPGGVDLAEVLFGAGGVPLDGPAALTAAGALVRRLEDAGVLHPDLNAKNVVLQPRAGCVRAYVVDLDRCRVGAPSAAVRGRAMRARLERSLHRHEARAGRPLAPGSWAALRAGFATPGGPA